MTGEELFELLGDVEEAYVGQARTAAPRPSRARWVKWGAAAACLALAVYGGAGLALRTAPGEPELPMLTIAQDIGGDMGFEGLMAYDVSELVSANPWTESAGLTTLPVYKNQLSYDEDNWVSGVDLDAMTALFYDAAARLGLDPGRLDPVINTPSFLRGNEFYPSTRNKKLGEYTPEETYYRSAKPELSAEYGGIEIMVSADLTAHITFDPALPLPEEFHWTYHASYQDTAAAAGFLMDAYPALLGMEEAQTDVYGGDRDIYLEQSYHIGFFSGSGDLTEQIVNYNFHRVQFFSDGEGKLWIVRIFAPDLSEKVGDYPIITAEEARELLLGGNYITTVPDAIPAAENIAKTELVYRTGEREEYFMPYYRFYVELPEWERDGLKTYGAFYVPAVEGTYLSHMPLWDGSFD